MREQSRPTGKRNGGPGWCLALLMAIMIAAAITLIGVQPANATRNFSNAAIADQALTHVGQNGGQCKQFANNMAVAGSGGLVHLGGGYYSDYAREGGIRVGAGAATKGDIIQLNGPSVDSFYSGMHTAIVVANLGGNSFDVVDSNWGTPSEIVHHHTWNPFATAAQYGLAVNIWRLGTVSSPTPPPQPPAPAPPTIPANAQGSIQGDFNGDGHIDAAVFYKYPNARTGIWVFNGDGHGNMSAPHLAWDSGENQWDATRIKPAVGDFNRDGKTDIAAFYGYNGATTVLFVFTSQGATFSAPVGIWNSGAGNWDWNAMQVNAGDVNGDGKTDLTAMYAYSGAQTAIFTFAGNGTGGFAGPASFWNSGAGNWYGTATKLVSGDVNADGKSDLIALYDYGNSNTSVFVLLSTGAAFTNPQGQWNSGAGNWSWSQSKLIAGDFTGDGRGDLGVFYGYPDSQTKIWVFSAAGSGLNAPTVAWDSGVNSWDISRAIPFSGDFTGDGKTDAGAFYAYDGDQTGQFLFTSAGATFGSPSGVWGSGAGQWNGTSVLVA